MTQRESHGVQFSGCPECGVSYGTRGMARHRKAAHGVQPVTAASKARAKAAAKANQPTLAERIALIEAKAAAERAMFEN